MVLNLLLILIFIRPFISSLSSPSFDMQYCYLLIALSLVLIKLKRRFSKAFSGQGYLLLFFLAVIASAFFSPQPFKSLQELPKFLCCFFIFYVAYYTDEKEKRKIILTLTLVASCVALYAICWFYFGSQNLLEYMEEQKIIYPFAQELLTRRRAFMPFVLPSMLAGYLIMMLPLSLGCLFKKNKVLLTFSTLLIAIALLLTKSVGAFLSIFLAFLIFIAFSRHFNKRIFFLLLILLLLLISIFILRSYKTEYFTSPLFSFRSRFIYWQNTVSIILRHPFQGRGLGNLPFIQSQFAHNSYLQIWAEIGLLGIIGFLGFLYHCLRSLQVKRINTDRLYAGLVIANLSFLIHNLVDFSFFLPEVSIYWWIVIALSLNPPNCISIGKE